MELNERAANARAVVMKRFMARISNSTIPNSTRSRKANILPRPTNNYVVIRRPGLANGR